MKNQCFLHSYIYNDIKNIKSSIKNVKCQKKKKKNGYTFWQGSQQNTKLLATAKQLIRKTSACCLKYQAFFSQSKRSDRLDPSAIPVCFRSLFKHPLLLLPFWMHPQVLFSSYWHFFQSSVLVAILSYNIKIWWKSPSWNLNISENHQYSIKKSVFLGCEPGWLEYQTLVMFHNIKI